MIDALPQSWGAPLADEVQSPYFGELTEFVRGERQTHEIYPPAEQTFTALEMSPPDAVRVVILGQDPYHGPGQAHGLAFSVPPGTPLPPSLRNIFTELRDDLGVEPPANGDLTDWARQGVLLLNTGLTVRAGDAGSHAGRGWERFTDAVIRVVVEHSPRAVFILWGNPARAKRDLLGPGNAVIESPHPSPLAAYRGFFGSRPFSRCNAALTEAGLPPINWSLP
jgi:uracil-DNA glycosylase